MSNISLFNSNAYNAALYYGSRVFSLGQIGLGHDPRLAHLITHDPYCPCGMQGLVQRNFKKSAALFAAVTLPLTYWKWRKSEFVVVGFFALLFYVAVREIYKASQTEFRNELIKNLFPVDGVSFELIENPVVHVHRHPSSVHRLQHDGSQDEAAYANTKAAGCDQTMDRAVIEEHLIKNNTGCAHCRADLSTSDLIINFVTAAIMARIRSNKDMEGKPLTTQSFSDMVGCYYALGDVKVQRSMIIHEGDGHTYPVEEYLTIVNRGRLEDNIVTAEDSIENKWLVELFQKISARRET